MTALNMTPRQKAHAYRIWAYCEPRGWDCTYAEIGEALGLHYCYVGKLIKARGWASRVRANRSDMVSSRRPLLFNGHVSIEDALDALGAHE